MRQILAVTAVVGLATSGANAADLPRPLPAQAPRRRLPIRF
jgi:hypothetical protein